MNNGTNKVSSTTRRDFLKCSMVVSAATAFPLLVPSTVFGANGRIRMAVIGLGQRGVPGHITGFGKEDGVEIVAICDPDRARLERAAGLTKDWYGRDVDTYTDMREVFARSDIDAVSIANHVYWHALSTIWACEAGKHVFVEKPASHYIWEGRQMVNAARKYDRIVQCGTQTRSSRAIQDAIQWTGEGHLGKIKRIYAFSAEDVGSAGKRNTPLEIPDTIDYDLWCGPAKKLPIYRNHLHSDCRLDWNTGGGETVDQGTHELDIARMWLGDDSLPRRTMSIGGRFKYDDAATTPNAHIMYYDFPTAPVIHEIYNMEVPKSHTEMSFAFEDGTALSLRRGEMGLIVEFEDGVVRMDTYARERQCVAYDRRGREIKMFSGRGDHYANFVNAVRSGRREDLNAEIEQGFLSTSSALTSTISLRVGETATVEEQRAQAKSVPGFEVAFDRFQSVLTGHGIDPNTAALGPWLEIDRENECIKNNDRANELVRGSYRESFEVPEVLR